MAIDLKAQWTTADVSTLLGSVADDRSWRLEVDADGIARLNDLTEIPDAAHEEALHCFFEIWDQGTDFVGPGAARGQELVRKNRENPSRKLSVAQRAENALGFMTG